MFNRKLVCCLGGLLAVFAVAAAPPGPFRTKSHKQAGFAPASCCAVAAACPCPAACKTSCNATSVGCCPVSPTCATLQWGTAAVVQGKPCAAPAASPRPTVAPLPPCCLVAKPAAIPTTSIPATPPPCCLVPQPAPSVTVFAKPVASKAGVDEVLDRLEALKAKKDAIESEEKELQAILKLRLEAQMRRVGKVGEPTTVYPTPVPVPPSAVRAPSVKYYEPVTNYQYRTVIDQKTGEKKHVVTPVTTYTLRDGKADPLVAPQPPRIDDSRTPPPAPDDCPTPPRSSNR